MPTYINTAATSTPPLWIQDTWFMPSVTIQVTTTTNTTIQTTGSGSTNTPVSNSNFDVLLLIMMTIPLALTVGMGKFAGGTGAMSGLLTGVTISTAIAWIGGMLPYPIVILFGVTDVVVLLLLLRSGGSGGG